MNKPLLSVNKLRVEFANTGIAVNEISLDIKAGETFALVGESGSGKSITALSVLRLLAPNAHLQADSIWLNDQDLSALTEQQLCHIRGRQIAMIFQDPMTSLNPVKTIGWQIEEVLKLHFSLDRQQLTDRTLELLHQVEIPDPVQRYRAYPHQLSGGQLQRIMIAIALAGKPKLLIADEPTTALDVTIQAQILELLKNIQKRTGMALWLISHDLALVSSIADRIAVMQKGRIVETGSTAEFFHHAQHPYTQQLLAALPSMDSCLERKAYEKPPLLQVKDYKVYYPIRKGVFKRVVGHVKAVDGVSLNLEQGKTLALVGESGCGKTSLGKGLLNLLPDTDGQVLLDGIDLQQLDHEQLRKQHAAMQIIFQDPFSSMNPRMLIADIITEGVGALHSKMSQGQRHELAVQLLQQVGLEPDAALRYPHEFSGGQRQRICIARALAVEPKLVICDEPTSALDVSVQAQIIDLLKQLQREKNISYLFITHDLAVVSEIADDVAVMKQGKIIEYGTVQQILKQPQQSYTQSLLSAVPILAPKPA